MIRALAAACIAAGAAAGQGRIEVRLPADPEHRGPPALVAVREVLAEFGAATPDPFAALVLELDGAGLRARPAAADATVAGALSATIEVDGSVIHAMCDAQGLEVWRSPGGRALRAAPLQAFAAATDLRRARGPVWLNVATLVGGRAAGIQMESPLGRLLTIGAVECGDLILDVQAEGEDIVVLGRSRGGLTLPALLLHLAATTTPPPTPTDAWRVLAFAARDGRREEAALHLAFATEPGATDTLRSLLYGNDAAQGRAAEALARRGDPAALSPLARALAAASPAQRPSVQAAMATLWPLASTDIRAHAERAAPPADDRRRATGTFVARVIAACLLFLAGLTLVSALRDRSPRRS